MAITPKSVVLNPTLFILAIISVAVPALLVFGMFSSPRISYWETVRATCPNAEGDPPAWSEHEWNVHVQCFLERREYPPAYAAAAEAVRYHPNSETLINYKGYAAGRDGEHAVAAFDFRDGLRRTGSPSGIFENNLAWTMLFQAQQVTPPRREPLLQQARGLYRESLTKRTSCERIHTGMYVEFAIAELRSEMTHDLVHDPAYRTALRNYQDLYEAYRPCWQRVRSGNALVTEEILSAAIVDAQMGRVAGVVHPTRHLGWLRAAREQGATSTMCDVTVPLVSTLRACKIAMR